MPRIPINKQKIKPREGPDRRGRFSKALRALGRGDSLECPPIKGYPRHPHQTVYYHNKVSEREGTEYRWTVMAPDRPGEPWIITRVS